MRKKWTQELLWVRRNDQGVMVGLSDKPPQTDDFIPTMPTLVQPKKDRHLKKAK